MDNEKTTTARNQWAIRKVAKHKQLDGIWCPIPLEGLGTVQIKVRARDTIKYQETVSRIYKPIRARYKENVPADLQHTLMLQIMQEAIISDWKDVPDNSGNPLPYNPENVIMFLDSFPDARDAVAAVSGEYSLYLADAEKEVLGNLSGG